MHVTAAAGEEQWTLEQIASVTVVGLLLAACIGFLIRQSNRRAEAREEEHRQIVETLPADLRGRSEHATALSAAGFVALLGGAAGGAMLGGEIGILMMLWTPVPLICLITYRESRHRARIAERALQHARMMDREQLRRFVHALETEHDAGSMRRVRDLLGE
jgi:hypothetical protein